MPVMCIWEHDVWCYKDIRHSYAAINKRGKYCVWQLLWGLAGVCCNKSAQSIEHIDIKAHVVFRIYFTVLSSVPQYILD
jgi:hypothetical protein